MTPFEFQEELYGSWN